MFDLISISEAIKRSYDSEGLLVDVRSEEVFKKGHLPMAVNLPFEEIMDEKFDIEAIEKDFNIEKEQPVFLYCDTGSTSMLAAKKKHRKHRMPPEHYSATAETQQICQHVQLQKKT